MPKGDTSSPDLDHGKLLEALEYYLNERPGLYENESTETLPQGEASEKILLSRPVSMISM